MRRSESLRIPTSASALLLVSCGDPPKRPMCGEPTPLEHGWYAAHELNGSIVVEYGCDEGYETLASGAYTTGLSCAPGQTECSGELGFACMPPTVIDTRTGLEWSRFVTVSQWEHAASYCDSLSLEGGGWRLPTVRELVSLYDYNGDGTATDEMTGLVWDSYGRPSSRGRSRCRSRSPRITARR